jgi:hypothetical protein
MPAAAEQLTAAQLDEVQPPSTPLHALHADRARAPAMRALDVHALPGAQPAFVIVALP